MRSISSSTLLIVVFLLIIVGASYYFTGGLPPTYLRNPNIITPTPHSVLVGPTSVSNQKGLQIGTIPTIDPSPTPTDVPTVVPTTHQVQPPPAVQPTVATGGPYCALDIRHGPDCVCPPGKQEVLQCSGTCPQGADFVPGSVKGSGCFITPDNAIYAQYKNDPNCGGYCVGKPVIYLYPTHPLFADVTVTTPGMIVKSDPHYPFGGWKHVFAQPDGSLTYHNKAYRELFYESSIQSLRTPENGIVLSLTHLNEQLTTLISQLGLTTAEQQEFLSYWLPRLYALHSPYIFFSVLPPSEKERIDHVTVSPEPDTRIEFLAYFKPLFVPFTTKPLLILPPSPKRIGFTEVEWGGTIDTTIY